MAKDYYQLLGISRNASAAEVKKAFRRLAHEHHPDKAGGNADKFKEINEAYQVLSNADKRRQYDQFGSAGVGGSGGFRGQDFGRGGAPFGQGFQSGGAHFDFGGAGFEDIGDLFGSFFGGGRQQRAQRGSDIETEITIDFAEAVSGIQRHISLNKTKPCSHCQGNGGEPGTTLKECATCRGRGRIVTVQQTFLGSLQAESTCPDCHGRGKRPEQKCRECHGSGVVRGADEFDITVPAGVDDGQAIRLTGRGEAIAGGAAGDLYVRIRVRPDRRFQRDGRTIRSEHRISIRQAILGDKIEIETVEGPVRLTIPEGTQSHTEFRLRDKGMPEIGGGRGDHIVTVIVDIPRRLTRQQRAIIEKLDH